MIFLIRNSHFDLYYLYSSTKQALERVKGLEPCFENAYGIYDSEDGTELNVIYHKQYNKRRK